MKAHLILKAILRDDRGATAVEYGLILSLLVIAMLGALQSVADENAELWTMLKTQVADAMP